MQLFRMGFDPFRRAEQAGLLAVPYGVDNRAFRPPLRFCELTDGPGFFEHWDEAADRIARAVHPCVVMIAADDPFIGAFVSAKPRNDIVRRHDIEIELQF